MSTSPPTFRQWLIASDLLPSVWTWGCGLGLPVLVYREIAPGVFDWYSGALTVVCLVVASLLGFVIALPSAWIMLGPIYMEQAERNGAPYEIGDEVEILCGSRKGEVARVDKLTQHGVQLELGEEARQAYNDIYAPSQVRRVPTSDPAPQSPGPKQDRGI